MNPRLTLTQQHAQETRQRILDAAAKAFARRGCDQATVQEIAAEAGVAVGSVYHHFSGKTDLARAVLAERIAADLDALRVPSSSTPETSDTLQQFWLDRVQSDSQSGRLFAEFCAQATREEWARDVVGEALHRLRAAIEGSLRRGQEAGTVRSDMSIEAAATLLLATYQGLCLLQYIGPEPRDLQGLAKPWVELIGRFIAADGGIPSGHRSGRGERRRPALQRSKPTRASGKEESL